LKEPASRILRVFIFLIAIVLLSTTRIPLPLLYLQLWPVGSWPFWLGAAVTIAGLLFAVWAREHFGSNWSRSVTIKQGHKLITTGPYAVVRHPIYTGILTGFLGMAIAISQVRGFIVVVLIFLAFRIKLRMEEQWMRSQFGETVCHVFLSSGDAVGPKFRWGKRGGPSPGTPVSAGRNP